PTSPTSSPITVITVTTRHGAWTSTTTTPSGSAARPASGASTSSTATPPPPAGNWSCGTAPTRPANGGTSTTPATTRSTCAARPARDHRTDVRVQPPQPASDKLSGWRSQLSTTQRWLLSPADAPGGIEPQPIDLSQNSRLPTSLEGLEAGGIADAFQAGTAN